MTLEEDNKLHCNVFDSYLLVSSLIIFELIREWTVSSYYIIITYQSWNACIFSRLFKKNGCLEGGGVRGGWRVFGTREQLLNFLKRKIGEVSLKRFPVFLAKAWDNICVEIWWWWRNCHCVNFLPTFGLLVFGRKKLSFATNSLLFPQINTN